MEIDPSVFLKIGETLITDKQNNRDTSCESISFKDEIDVFIEISKNSHIKYEYDKERKSLICDRILHTPFKYSFNYGFVPDTLSEDKDPLDVIVLIDEELIPGCYIKCKIWRSSYSKINKYESYRFIRNILGNIFKTNYNNWIKTR